MADTSRGRIPSTDSARRWTVADLVAFIAGVSVALAFTREEVPLNESVAWGALRWIVPGLWLAGEVCGRFALALLPVAVLRAARRGDAVRPGVFLLACAGLPWLDSGLEFSLRLAWLKRRGIGADLAEDFPIDWWNDWVALATPAFRWGGAALTTSALLVVIAGRRRMPRWIASVLMMAAWIGAEAFFHRRRWVGMVTPLFEPRWMWYSTTGRFLYSISQDLPYLLLFTVPMASTWIHRRAIRGGLEWLGGGLLLAYGLADRLPQVLFSIRWSSGSKLALGLFQVESPLLLAAPLGYWIAARVLPAWRRFLGLGYDGGGPALSPTEG